MKVVPQLSLRYVKDVSRLLRCAGTPVFAGLLVLITAAAAMAAQPAKSALDALKIYEGTWHVTRSGQGANAKPDTLVNHCVTLGIYFACEQNVNDKPTALLVFISAGQPGHYLTQSILPEGRATGLDQLEIAGNRWIFTSRRHLGANATYFRNTNVFVDPNHIHFENAQSPNGKTWTVQESGDETRVSR